MGVISSIVDRLLHTTAQPPSNAPSAGAVELHRSAAVVDLVVGTALFRNSLVHGGGRGHVDLARLRAGGVNVIGLTLATRFPDLRGTLSAPHFRSLGAPRRALASGMATIEWLVRRIERWCTDSGGSLVLLRGEAELEAALEPGGPVGIFLGLQGAHALDGRLDNLEWLRAWGVRMLAPAHVMDNEYVGSSTGSRRGGLTGSGRELLAEIERQGLLLDLAHMSAAGMEDCLALASQVPLISHTGLLSVNTQSSRWRRYSPATRNVPDWAVEAVARRGGLVGLTLSTKLLGVSGVEGAARVFVAALQRAGPTGVAIGSDMDGGLRMVLDAAGLPHLTDALLRAGVSEPAVRAVLGTNALRLLSLTAR